MVSAGINSPLTSSLGRLFDAAAALCGICMENSCEAQAAMGLEALCEEILQGASLNEKEAFEYFFKDGSLVRRKGEMFELDWVPFWQKNADIAAKRPAEFSLFFTALLWPGFL